MPRSLLIAVIASAGLHLAVMAGRLPGSALAPRDTASPVVLSTRLIAASPSPEEATRTAPVEATAAATVATPAAAAAPALPETAAPALLVTPASASISEPPPVVAPVARAGGSPSLPESLSKPRVNETAPVGAGAPGGPAEPRGIAGDRGPQLLDDIDTTLPAGAGGRGGSVTVRLVISEQGGIERVQVLRSQPPGLLDEAALAALAKVHFSPGLRGGVPVRSEVVYEIDFAAISRGTEASGRAY